MERHFQQERQARQGSLMKLAGLWLTAVVDIVWHGTLERLSIHRSVSSGVRYVARPAAARTSVLGRLFGTALLADIRIGARRLRRAPGFTLVAVTTLALGIGANTAIFSVVNAVLIRPLPFSEPDRLVGLFQVWEGDRDVFSPPNFLDVQARATTLAAAGAYTTSRFVLTDAGDPASIVGARTSAGFFETLASAPVVGRWLGRADNDEGAARVVVLGHALWRDRFGSDPDVLGRSVTLDSNAHEVVGVMPAGFSWPADAEFWVPAAYDESYRVTNRGAWFLDVVGRLAPGASIEQSAAELAAIAAQLEQEYPDVNTKVGMTVHPLLDAMVGDTRRALLVLLSAVGLVLLIACVNVANLFLARASTREGEFAVRSALGADRLHLVRQLLVEGLLLAGLGGLAGLALASAGGAVLVHYSPAGIPRLGSVRLDGNVVMFTTAATLLTGLVFGLLPGLQASRRSLTAALHERGRSGTAGRRGQRLRGGLVVAETALAVILLAGAGLLGRSFLKLSHVDPGFAVGQAVTFELVLPTTAYPEDEHRIAFYTDLRERLAALPGVAGLGAVLGVPPGGSMLNLTFSVRGRPQAPPGEEAAMEVRVADVGYFDVMGIPVVRGRSFDDTDRAGAAPVLLLTESAARRHFADEDPLGQYVEVGWGRGDGQVGGTVIGVVGDVKSLGLDRDSPPQVYVPLAQAPIRQMDFVVRTSGDATLLARPVRAVLAEIDPQLPAPSILTLDEHVRGTIAEQRFFMLLVGVFASAATTLAAIGIFGVLSFLVAQRRREIGVRMALGARPGAVVSMVLGRALVLVGVGVTIGVIGALGLSSLMSSLLFDLPATDPLSFGGAAVGLLLVAMVAAWIPARRASGVDPITALRTE